MKKIIFYSMLLVSTMAYSQEEEAKAASTKMDEFASRTGEIVRYEDYKIYDLRLTYGIALTKVRKIFAGGEAKLFYLITYEGKYGSKIAAIAHEDLIEVQKALDVLKSKVLEDEKKGLDYIENAFMTDDGFELGYYIKGGSAHWYMVLVKYGSDKTIFTKNVNTIEQAFSAALAKIDELK